MYSSVANTRTGVQWCKVQFSEVLLYRKQGTVKTWHRRLLNQHSWDDWWLWNDWYVDLLQWKWLAVFNSPAQYLGFWTIVWPWMFRINFRLLVLADLELRARGRTIFYTNTLKQYSLHFEFLQMGPKSMKHIVTLARTVVIFSYPDTNKFFLTEYGSSVGDIRNCKSVHLRTGKEFLAAIRFGKKRQQIFLLISIWVYLETLTAHIYWLISNSGKLWSSKSFDWYALKQGGKRW